MSVRTLIGSAPAPAPALAEEFDDLERRSVTAERRVAELERQRPQAEEDDRRAMAEAIRVSKPDPGPTAIEALEAEIKATTRESQALADAYRLAGDELIVELSGGVGATWRGHLREERSKQTRRAAKALEEAAGAIVEFEVFREAEAWLQEVTSRRVIAVWSHNVPAITPPHQNNPYAPLRRQLKGIQVEVERIGGEG